MKDIRILNIIITHVPHHDRGAYGETVSISDYGRCETIAAKTIIENNFDFSDKEIHLFRSVLGMTLKEFGECLQVTDTAVLKWENGNKIPHAQKVLIKLFMREKLKLTPIIYRKLIQFNAPALITISFRKNEIFKQKKAA